MHRWRRVRAELSAHTKMAHAATALGRRLVMHGAMRHWGAVVGSRRTATMQEMQAVCEWRLDALMQVQPTASSQQLGASWQYPVSICQLQGQ